MWPNLHRCVRARMLITYLSQISVIEPNFFVLKAFSQIMENEILYLVAVYMMLDPLSLLSKMKNVSICICIMLYLFSNIFSLSCNVQVHSLYLLSPSRFLCVTLGRWWRDISYKRYSHEGKKLDSNKSSKSGNHKKIDLQGSKTHFQCNNLKAFKYIWTGNID